MYVWIISCVLMLGIVRGVWAKRVYVSDETVEINVRTGPSLQNKIIALLKVGDPLELIEVNAGWAHVKLDDGRAGWTLNKYLMGRLPWRMKAVLLEKANQKLKISLAKLKQENEGLLKEKNNLTASLQKITDELKKVKESYETLKSGASTFLELKKSYDELTEKSKVIQNELNALRQQNSKLRTSQNIRWFLSGAAVLVFGWLVGLQMGKAKKWRKSRLYYD